MLSLVLVLRIILIVFTLIILLGALAKENKDKWDWQVIVYLAIIIAYIIAR